MQKVLSLDLFQTAAHAVRVSDLPEVALFCLRIFLGGYPREPERIGYNTASALDVSDSITHSVHIINGRTSPTAFCKR